MKYNGAPWITRGKSDDRQSKWSITNNILSEHITQLIQLEEGGGGCQRGFCFKILIRYSVKSFKTTFSVTLAYCSWVISLSSSAARASLLWKEKSPVIKWMCLLRRSIRRRSGCSAVSLFILRVQRQAVCKLLLYSLLNYFPVQWLLVKSHGISCKGGLDVNSEGKHLSNDEGGGRGIFKLK